MIAARDSTAESGRRGRRVPWAWVAVVALTALLSGAVAAAVAAAVVRSESRTNPQSVDLGSHVTITEDNAVQQVAARALPAVVTVLAGPGAGAAHGSGFIVTKDGYIVTSTDVVANATDLQVMLPDYSVRNAQVVDSDCAAGFAVLKIGSVANLPTLTFGDSDSLSLGETVVGLGGPLETQSRVVHGIVSDNHQPDFVADPLAPGRQIQRSDTIQVDSPLGLGDAGGPLLNVGGEVVGVEAAYSSAGSVHSFALPSNAIAAEVQQVVQGGQLSVPSMEAQWIDLAGLQAATLGLSGGALITAVTPGGPAAAAGIKAGDVVTQVDDVKVDQAHPLGVDLLNQFRGGQEVAVTVKSGGNSIQLPVTLVAQHPACA